MATTHTIAALLRPRLKKTLSPFIQAGSGLMGHGQVMLLRLVPFVSARRPETLSAVLRSHRLTQASQVFAGIAVVVLGVFLLCGRG